MRRVVNLVQFLQFRVNFYSLGTALVQFLQFRVRLDLIRDFGKFLLQVSINEGTDVLICLILIFGGPGGNKKLEKIRCGKAN